MVDAGALRVPRHGVHASTCSSSRTTSSCRTGRCGARTPARRSTASAPSGEPVEINGTAILRIRDGKIVEHWGGPHCQDGVGLTH